MNRPRMALLAEALDFEETYSDLVWRAADRRARERDVDLVVCVGRRLGGYGFGDEAHNRILGLALAGTWSAVMAVHPLYQHLPEDQRQRLAQGLARHRSATSTVPLGRIPVVGYENRSGMKSLLGHLIRDHNKKRLLFVTGPRQVADAQAREQVWHEVCADAGLPHGPEWMVQGDFNPTLVPDVVAHVVERCQALQPDAVVTSSDLMASVLLRELPLQGIRIPEDLSVTGYDDIPLAAHLSPALTTVRQPIERQIGRVFDLALDGIAAEEPAEGELVIRRSCGCEGTLPDPHESRRELEISYERGRHLRSLVATLNLFAGQLNALHGLEALGPLLLEWMPRLGMTEFSLSLSCTPDGKIEPWNVASNWDETAGTFLRWMAGSPDVSSTTSLVFPACEMAPLEWWTRPTRHTCLAVPLALGSSAYGVLIVTPGPESNVLTQSLQELLGGFVDRVYRLNREVRKSLEARLSSQIAAEKTQTLGVLLAGISHDLATPFSVGRDSIELLSHATKTTRSRFDSGQLSKADLQAYWEQTSTLTDLLGSLWERATELVDRFKRIGTELPREELRQVPLKPFLTDLIKTLEPLWRRRPIQFDLHVEPMVVQTHASALVDIATNLIQNCLLHAFERKDRGRIRLACRAVGDDCLLTIDDDGEGVPHGLRAKVFEPYVTTRDGRGGTGLGLAVVRQHVQGLLCGTVTCEDSPLGGARFTVRFPRILQR